MAKKGGNTAIPKGTETQANDGKRDSPVNIVVTLEERVEKLEGSMKDAQDDFDIVKVRLEELESAGEELEGSVRELKSNVRDLDRCADSMDRRSDELEAELKALKAEMMEEMKQLRGELHIYKAAVNGVLTTATTGPKLDVPKPKEFNGNRSAQDVENFVWSMKQYFCAVGIKDDVDKVNIASVYLTDYAFLWWRRRCSEEKSKDCPIRTWGEFQAEFKEQFYPTNAQQEAREKLHELKHEGSITEYVRQFTELKLQIKDMTEAEALFVFKNGLKRWAKMELKRMGVEEFSKAMTEVESIAEFEIIETTKPRGKGYGGGVKNVEVLRCFTCGGNQMKSDCPTNDRLNAIQGNGIEESEEEVMRLGAIASVNKPRESRGTTTSGKVVEPRPRPGVIADDKAVKPRVEKTPIECHRFKGPHRVRECPR
ncbi:hypothetical protein HRI_003099700 [Hibiscus trionum]|uniref:Retrotransposon gag domain-containing protein n=1 Tax=Hibiscus trionum TaxID=183268 RepID=A0A9W7ICA4_HIBTR|nr:hypothetical protein HRI_003099700 [Hibiscus trionum]